MFTDNFEVFCYLNLESIVLGCQSTHLPIPQIQQLGPVVHYLGAVQVVGCGLTPGENGSVQKRLIGIQTCKTQSFQFAKTNWLETHTISYLSLRQGLFNYQDPLILIRILVIWIVKFPTKEYKIRQIFGPKSRYYKEIIVHISLIQMALSCQKVLKNDFKIQFL